MAKVRDYRVWAAEEEDALRLGVAKHGIGAWEIIRQDPAYRSLLMCALAAALPLSHVALKCTKLPSRAWQRPLHLPCSVLTRPCLPRGAETGRASSSKTSGATSSSSSMFRAQRWMPFVGPRRSIGLPRLNAPNCEHLCLEDHRLSGHADADDLYVVAMAGGGVACGLCGDAPRVWSRWRRLSSSVATTLRATSAPRVWVHDSAKWGVCAALAVLEIFLLSPTRHTWQ